MHDINDAANVLVVVAGLSTLTFAAIYGFGSNWRALPVGRAMLIFVSSLGLVLVQNSVSIYTGQDYPGRGLIRFTLYAGILVASVQLNRELHRMRTDDEYDPLGYRAAAREAARQEVQLIRADLETQMRDELMVRLGLTTLHVEPLDPEPLGPSDVRS